MTDIQLYENAFDVNFPVQIADKLLERLQKNYGDLFNKKFSNQTPEELLQNTCIALNGLKPKDLERGLKRMLTEKWCPNLSEFRNWCLPEWWTADQAWAKAMLFEANPKQKISMLTKTALDEVRHVLTIEGQKAAHKAFKDIYDTYLRKAIELGREQQMYAPPKQNLIAQNYTPRSGVACPPELVEKVKVGFKRGAA